MSNMINDEKTLKNAIAALLDMVDFSESEAAFVKSIESVNELASFVKNPNNYVSAHAATQIGALDKIVDFLGGLYSA